MNSFIKEGYLVKSTTLEVTLSTGVSNYRLPDSDTLRNKRIVGLQANQTTSSSTRKSTGGATLVGNDTLSVSYLNLLRDNKRILHDMPMNLLVFDESDRGVYPVNAFGFNPSQSYIYISDSSTIVDGEVIQLVFMYMDVDDDNYFS